MLSFQEFDDNKISTANAATTKRAIFVTPRMTSTKLVSQANEINPPIRNKTAAIAMPSSTPMNIL